MTRIDLFGNEIPADRNPKRFETDAETQATLFSKTGKPGQANLFADIGVPDDLVAKPPREEK